VLVASSPVTVTPIDVSFPRMSPVARVPGS
jgi:hypothetical protein